MFDSLKKYWPEKAIAILLSGMGKDGAIGLKSLKDNGWYTIAQDQESSAVYGMPKAAAQLGAVSEVLAISRIASRLEEIVGK